MTAGLSDLGNLLTQSGLRRGRAYSEEGYDEVEKLEADSSSSVGERSGSCARARELIDGGREGE